MLQVQQSCFFNQPRLNKGWKKKEGKIGTDSSKYSLAVEEWEEHQAILFTVHKMAKKQVDSSYE